MQWDVFEKQMNWVCDTNDIIERRKLHSNDIIMWIIISKVRSYVLALEKAVTNSDLSWITKIYTY